MGVILNAFRLAPAGGYDAATLAYLAATGITDPGISDALDALVVGMKADGSWSECVAIYPFPGPTSSENAVNLKSPGTYDLTYTGGLTHSSTGMLPDGTTGYADTGLVPASVLASSDTHLSFYSRTSNTTNTDDIGIYAGVNYHGLTLSCYFSYSGNTGYSAQYDGGASLDAATVTSAVSTNSLGFFVGSRVSSASHIMYKNAVAGTTTTLLTGDFPSIINSVKICASGYNSGILRYSNRECAFASIGFGLDGSQVADLYTRVQAYQTALGRQV